MPCLILQNVYICKICLCIEFGGTLSDDKENAKNFSNIVESDDDRSEYRLFRRWVAHETSMAGCALCGVSVGIMWPGSISISAQKCPAGGTAMFALLALAGDLGGSIGPSMVGFFSGMADGDLKVGLLAAAIFPVVLIIGLAALKKRVK